MGVVLSLIIGLSLILRGSYITISPPELFGDEIDVGYQAYSLLKTGRDLYNQSFPTYIHSLSEWRMPLLMYFTVPTIAVFGNTEAGVRAPEIILGTLGIALIFLLGYETTRSKLISLLAAFSLCLSPWHFQYSRAAFEVVLLLDLLILGSLLFIKKRYLLSVIFFALTFYTYSTAIVFTPLLIISLIIFNKKIPGIKFILLLLLLLIPATYNLFYGKAAERFGTVSIINHPKILEKATEIRSSSLSPFEKFLTNRPLLTFRLALNNYLSAFSSEFLFTKGDPTIRHNTNFTGQLLPVMAFPLIVGLYQLAKKRQFIWLVWLALAPVPASLTYDGAHHATRLFILLPPLAVAIGYGLSEFWQTRRRLLLGIPITMLVLFQFVQFANYYFYNYPKESWRWWHVGFKTALNQLAKVDSNYSRIFINNTYEPSLIRFLFYTKFAPETFHRVFTIDQPGIGVYPNYYGFFLPPKYYFGNFSFPPNKSLPDVLEAENLYLISQRENAWGDWRKDPPGGVKVLFTSTNSYNDPILYLVTRP